MLHGPLKYGAKMNFLHLFVLFVIPSYSWAFSPRNLFCSDPCQTTKGPGSYGKSLSDIRFQTDHCRVAYRRPLQCHHRDYNQADAQKKRDPRTIRTTHERPH